MQKESNKQKGEGNYCNSNIQFKKYNTIHFLIKNLKSTFPLISVIYSCVKKNLNSLYILKYDTYNTKKMPSRYRKLMMCISRIRLI